MCRVNERDMESWCGIIFNHKHQSCFLVFMEKVVDLPHHWKIVCWGNEDFGLSRVFNSQEAAEEVYAKIGDETEIADLEEMSFKEINL